MSVTLHLRPEVEARLLAQAAAQGLTLDDYLLEIVENAVASASDSPSKSAEKRVEAVRQMLAFGEKYRLSLDEPITRELLHRDHRF